jgi:hypothetical protein
MVLVGPAHDLPHLQDEFYLVQPNLDLPSARIRERRSCSVSNFSIYKLHIIEIQRVYIISSFENTPYINIFRIKIFCCLFELPR